MDEHWRIEFDADVTFVNGGGLQTQGFRLDIADEAIDDAQLADYFVHRHLGLLLVDTVTIRRRQLIREAHKGSRGGPSDPTQRNEGRPDGAR